MELDAETKQLVREIHEIVKNIYQELSELNHEKRQRLLKIERRIWELEQTRQTNKRIK